MGDFPNDCLSMRRKRQTQSLGHKCRTIPPYAVRASLAGMGEEQGLFSIPLYAMERMMDILP